MADYTQLPVWFKAHQLALKFYKLTAKFPQGEWLTSHMRDSAAAIPMHIVSAVNRGHGQDAVQELGLSVDACSRLDYLLLMCRDLNLVGSFDYDLLHGELKAIRTLLAATPAQLPHLR